MKCKFTDKSKRYGTLIICCLFYLLWLAIDGYTVKADTQGYVMFALSREPVYPLFLAFFRGIFGTETYFYWVAAAQCVLTGYATWKITDVLTKQFCLGKTSTIIILGLQIAVNMVNRFLSVKKTLYCLEIQTEGVALPLFILFFVQLFMYAVSQKRKNLIGVVGYAILLISTRKQMNVVLVIMVMTALLLLILKHIDWKKIAIFIIMTMVTLFLTRATERGYNYLVRGEAVGHTENSSAFLNNCIFVAEPSDGDKFTDLELRELFLDMLKQVESQGWGYKSAPKNWYEMRAFYADNYDKIAFEVVNPSIAKYVERKGYNDNVERAIAFDEVTEQLLQVLIVQHLPEKLRIIIANAVIGFVNTIAKNAPFLVVVACVIYILFLGTYILQRCMARQLELDILMGMTCISIVSNVCIVAVLIFTQSRYMIYNMPIFYTTFFLLARQVLIKVVKNDKTSLK